MFIINYEHGLMQEVDDMNSFLEECSAQLEAEHSSAQREAEAFADVLAQVQRMISSYVRLRPQAEHHCCAWQVPVYRAGLVIVWDDLRLRYESQVKTSEPGQHLILTSLVTSTCYCLQDALQPGSGNKRPSME